MYVVYLIDQRPSANGKKHLWFHRPVAPSFIAGNGVSPDPYYHIANIEGVDSVWMIPGTVEK